MYKRQEQEHLLGLLGRSERRRNARSAARVEVHPRLDQDVFRPLCRGKGRGDGGDARKVVRPAETLLVTFVVRPAAARTAVSAGERGADKGADIKSLVEST